MTATVNTEQAADHWRWHHLDREMRAKAKARYGGRTGKGQCIHTILHPRPCRVVRTAEGGIIVDPAWLADAQNGFQVFDSARMDPQYQSWRQTQVLANLPLMGWTLPRGSMPGRWDILGNGPSAADWKDDDEGAAAGGYTLAINGALEIPMKYGVEVDLWVVADSLDPHNSWQPQPWLDKIGGLPPGQQGAFRVNANSVLTHACDAAGRAHFFLPATMEHRDIIRPDIARRLPVITEGCQSLPGAMNLAYWLGATEVHLWGCDQGWPGVEAPTLDRYYAAESTPPPSGNRNDPAKMLAVPGVTGVCRTTPQHMLFAEQADAVAMFLQDAGCPVWNRSKGVLYDFAPVPDPGD